MRSTFIQSLIERARVDENLFLVTPDIGFSVLEKFRDKFPNRFLNVGIAEQNAISIACGMALSGKRVYVYSIIPFVTMRCFEQIRLDVAYMNTNVRIVGVGAGLSYGPAGASHHAIEDIAIMRSLPNMTVCCPGDPIETKGIMQHSFNYNGPMYIRLGKNGEPNINSEKTQVIVGKAISVIDGNDLALITTSNMLEQGKKWVEEWKSENINASLVSMHTIKPIDANFILNLVKKRIPIITLEEHSIIGGLGTAVAEIIAESGSAIIFKRIGINDVYTHYVGGQSCLREKLEILKKPSVKNILGKME